jgi:hypothetical protein
MVKIMMLLGILACWVLWLGGIASRPTVATDDDLAKIYGEGVQGATCQNTSEVECTVSANCGTPTLVIDTIANQFVYKCLGVKGGCEGPRPQLCKYLTGSTNVCHQKPNKECCVRRRCVRVPPTGGPNPEGTCADTGMPSGNATGIRTDC